MRCSRWLARPGNCTRMTAPANLLRRPADSAAHPEPIHRHPADAVQWRPFPLEPSVSGEASHESPVCPAPGRRPRWCRAFWLWLVFLSVLVALGYLAMRDQADQERLDSRLQRLEVQATGLAEDVEAIQQRPSRRPLTSRHPPDPGSTRGPGREWLTTEHAAADDLQALRAEIRADQGAPDRRRHQAPPAARITQVRRLKTELSPLPFRRRRRRTARRASAACRRAASRGLQRPPNFRCCCPGMRSARGVCRRSRAMPRCSRSADHAPPRGDSPTGAHPMKAVDPPFRGRGGVVAVARLGAAARNDPARNAQSQERPLAARVLDDRGSRNGACGPQEWARYRELMDGPLGIYRPTWTRCLRPGHRGPHGRRTAPLRRNCRCRWKTRRVGCSPTSAPDRGSGSA